MLIELKKRACRQRGRLRLGIGDHLLSECQHMLHTLSGVIKAERASPADAVEQAQPGLDCELSAAERQRSIEFMRINHTGEVCAQALYRGQALLARDSATHAMLLQAGDEEQDHLQWCAQRVHELGGRTSFLAPFFYGGSLMIGMVAAASGDKLSMGFIEETEQQVESHLAGHADRLGEKDKKSQAVIAQMISDEARHAQQARAHDAAALPGVIRWGMHMVSKVMTMTTRKI